MEPVTALYYKARAGKPNTSCTSSLPCRIDQEPQTQPMCNPVLLLDLLPLLTAGSSGEEFLLAAFKRAQMAKPAACSFVLVGTTASPLGQLPVIAVWLLVPPGWQPPHVTTTPELEQSTRGQMRTGLGKANPAKRSGLWKQEVVSIIAVF